MHGLARRLHARADSVLLRDQPEQQNDMRTAARLVEQLIQLRTDIRRAADTAMTKITVDLPPDQAEALAQVCKRFTYEDAERFANRHDGGRERDAILEGTAALQRALAEAGYAPR